MITEMRRSGYGATDLGDLGFLPTDPARSRNMLRGISMMGAFVEVSLSKVSESRRVSNRFLLSINF